MKMGGSLISQSGVGDWRICEMSTPEVPSIMQWWILLIRAKRPPSRPSTTQISHSGRSRSRCWAMMRAARFFSWLSEPGFGRPE